MIILTDLSEVLIRGLYGVDGIIASRFGQETAKLYNNRRSEVGEQLQNLFRGKMTESGFWHIFFESCELPFGCDEMMNFFSENLKHIIPGTLEVFRDVVAFPDSFDSPQKTTGCPDIYVVSDHVKERINEVRHLHPEVFNIMSGTFWSCDFGSIKRDGDFLTHVLNSVSIRPEEAVFIDDSEANIIAAQREFSGRLQTIQFQNADALKCKLIELGFEFRD